MIPATQAKLRETQFFLAHLEEQGRIPVWKVNPEIAEFHFSAFVSAGRSVTWTLQCEEKARYDAWFPGWRSKCSPEETLTMNRFRDERTEIVKRTGSTLSSRNVLTPHDEVFPVPSYSVTYAITRLQNQASEAKVGTKQLVCCFSFDGAEIVAVDAAKEYVAILERLVHDFLRSHESTAEPGE